MVYITGDIHGEVCRISRIVKKYNITPEDIIVILGDVGVNYFGNRADDMRGKVEINSLGVPILCIHGNHEMRPETLWTYVETQWNGGAVYGKKHSPISSSQKTARFMIWKGRRR